MATAISDFMVLSWVDVEDSPFKFAFPELRDRTLY